MKVRLIFYAIVILVGFFVICNFIHVGDYCWGLTNAIFEGFLLVGCIGVYMILASIKTYRFLKKKEKFDSLFFILTFLSIGSLYLVSEYQEKPLFKNIVMEAEPIDFDKAQFFELKLFDDNTFEVKIKEIEYACYYTGDFTMENDVLFLQRDDLETQTDSLVTNRYFLLKKDSLMHTNSQGFSPLKIRIMKELK